MKKTALLFFLMINSLFINYQSSYSEANPFTVELARQFSSDIFYSNGVPFLQPVVKVVNLTSNTGFFSSAYVPSEVSKPYFRFSIEGMVGFVPDKFKSYTPSMPNEQYDPNSIGRYVSFSQNGLSIDTAGLIHYFFLNLMYDGIYGDHKGMITIPESSPTALGNQVTYFDIRHSALDSLVRAHPLYSTLEAYGLQDTVLNVVNSFPERFTLPSGGNINTLVAGVPQLIIGSYWGTELLLRFVPKVNLGSTIGDFSFWGVGLKHSLSQYFDRIPFESALQVVYQGTSLDNTVGVTNAKLKADANILNVNLHFSADIPKILTVFTGVSYESISIKSTYTYLIPVEVQYQLGLLDPPNTEPTPGFPGDQNPQVAKVNVSDNHFKFSLGVSRVIGPILLSGSLNITDMILLGFSLGYNF